ncbi:MAG: ABC transporter permease [Myxococcota bacterium]|nr:ABC transporter permease [Myxococcota bacterium]
MKTAFYIAHREFAGYFNQTIAYVVLGCFLVLCGAYTFVLTPFFVVNNANIRPFFEFCPFIMTLVVPAITMRSIAEDRRRGMLELLQSWPIGDLELVIGKFLGALGLVVIGLLLTLALPLAISQIGDLDWGPVWGGYVGLFFLCSAYVAIGLFASALTNRQVIAFILGFGMCFGFFVVGQGADSLPQPLGQFALEMSFWQRFKPVTTGVLDLRDLVYFGSLTLVCLGITAEVLHRRTWKR